LRRARRGTGAAAGGVVSALILLLAVPSPAPALNWEGDRYWLALEGGGTYIDEPVRFLLASLLVSLDGADAEGLLPSLDPWHFRLELSSGLKVNRPFGIMASAVVFAQRHLRLLDAEDIHPFVEGGMGLIYTEYRIRHQPLHLDFNPNLGFGCDIGKAGAPHATLSLRWHHVSNANIRPPNNGVNSVVFVVGIPLS
jgi:lipid A 3-O-deacylase